MHWAYLARRQAGVVRRSQLLTLGLTRSRIHHMLRSGRLIRTEHSGVYRAAGAPDSADSAAWAAVLGARAVLSYLSAADWWELPVASDGRLHVTRHERRKFATHRGIRVHRTLLVPSAVTTR